MSHLIFRSLPTSPLNNYVHVIHDSDAGVTVCVDPSDDPSIVERLKTWGWSVTHILVTHPHYDHIDGIAGLVDAFNCEVYGSRHDLGIIPKCDFGVMDGDVINIASMNFRVLGVPGHTRNHVAYYLESEDALFSGDTLFSLGCGRLFCGTAAELWDSLKKIRDLPKQTKIYFSHEYTEDNAVFALSVDGDNVDLKDRAHDVHHLRSQGRATVPSLLGEEIKCNPFLRCDVPELQTAMGMAGKNGEEVFAELRRQKDHFRPAPRQKSILRDIKR